MKRTAYISPTVAGYTVVYDKETEDQDPLTMKKLAGSLTRKFRCNGLAALVLDGDVFIYWLYDKGRLVDTYNSAPGYLDAWGTGVSPPTGGDSRRLCASFNAPNAFGAVERVFELARNANLKGQSEGCLIGEDIHRELAEALNIPLFAVDTGYYTIANGFLSDKFDVSTFRKAG